MINSTISHFFNQNRFNWAYRYFEALKYTRFFQKMESFATLQWGLKIAHSVLALFQNTHIHGRHSLSFPIFFPHISHLQGSYSLVYLDWHSLLSSDWMKWDDWQLSRVQEQQAVAPPLGCARAWVCCEHLKIREKRGEGKEGGEKWGTETTELTWEGEKRFGIALKKKGGGKNGRKRGEKEVKEEEVSQRCERKDQLFIWNVS